MTAGEWWTPQQVITQAVKEIGLELSFDVSKEDEEVSVLNTADERFGYFSIWVFKHSERATDYAIGGLQVLAPGEVAWSEWEALDRKLPPGEGTSRS